jgi:hypothetical protein
MARERRQSTQTVAWFSDLYKRDLLDLSPAYQRRSVWNQAYKDYFVETISEDGRASYAVVDGKQRLSTVFDFAAGDFPVSDKCVIERLRGLYFSQLTSEEKKNFWTYQFGVEYLPTTDEGTLNNIFDRINRNVARLTPQELRHAKFDGVFATIAEDLSEFMFKELSSDFPRIAAASRRQMKDVELVVQLLLLIEDGPKAYSQNDLDAEYSARDEEWAEHLEIEREFRATIAILKEIPTDLLAGSAKRLKNQADFYSLFGAVLTLTRQGRLPGLDLMVGQIQDFFAVVVDDNLRMKSSSARRYYEAARSNSNDLVQRHDRIAIMCDVLTGEWLGAGS